jgi:Flp pilus assembly protein CpaB
MEYAQKLMSTRAGTIAVAGGAALLAGIFILVYLNRYRHSVKAQGAPVTVLVAKRLIPKGTTGTAVASGVFYERTTIRQSQLLNGAFSDVASLRGRVAARDVLANQQLTAADFTTTAQSLASGLTGAQRVIDVPLDTAHGLTGHLQAGDRVNVFVGFNVTVRGSGQTFPVSRLLAQGVPVADVAKKAGGFGAGANTTTNVSLRVNDAQAAAIAFAADNGKVWLVLRPPTGAPPVRPGLVTAGTILLGVPPVQLPSNGAIAGRSLTRQLQKALASVGAR